MSRTDHLYMPDDNMESLYTSPNPLVRFVHVQRLEKIVEELPTGEKLNILDAGCGEGHLLQMMHARFPAYTYYGADIMENALVKCRERAPFATCKKTDLDKLPFHDGFFDVIVCTEVLEHVFEYQQVLKEFSRVLKAGGTMIITHPNETNWTISRFLLGRRPIKVPDHVNAFSPRAFSLSVGMTQEKQLNLPFGLPFMLSLTCLHKFKKN